MLFSLESLTRTCLTTRVLPEMEKGEFITQSGLS